MQTPGRGLNLEALGEILGSLSYGSSTVPEESAKYFVFL